VKICSHQKLTAYEVPLALPRIHVMWRVSEISKTADRNER